MTTLFFLNLPKLIYRLYFLLVVCVFFSTIDIIPTYLYYMFFFLILILISFLFFIILRSDFLNSNDILYWLLFCFPILLSYTFNINANPNFSRLFLIVFIYPILFFLMRYIFSKFKVYKVIFPVIFSIALISILSLLSSIGVLNFEFYSANQDSLDFYSDVYSRDRLLALNGIYLNQNSFASILLIGFFSFLISFFSLHEKKYKIICSIFLLIILGLLFLTLARAPIFSLIVGLLIFFILSNIRFYRKLWYIVFVFVSFVFVISYNADYLTMFLEKINSAGMSYRDVIWNDVFEKINHNFFIGVGLGNYQFMDGYHSYSTHNLYLFFLVSLGFFGSFSIFFTLFKFLKIIFFSFYKLRKDKMVLIFSCSAFSMLIHQFFEVELDNPLKPFSFFFILSVAYLYSNRTNEPR